MKRFLWRKYFVDLLLRELENADTIQCDSQTKILCLRTPRYEIVVDYFRSYLTISLWIGFNFIASGSFTFKKSKPRPTDAKSLAELAKAYKHRLKHIWLRVHGITVLKTDTTFGDAEEFVVRPIINNMILRVKCKEKAWKPEAWWFNSHIEFDIRLDSNTEAYIYNDEREANIDIIAEVL